MFISSILFVFLSRILAANCLQCLGSQSEVFSFNLKSNRNETGHHHVEMVMSCKADATNNALSNSIMDVTRNMQLCNGMKVLTTRVEITAQEKGILPLDYEFIPGFGYYKLYTRGDIWENCVRTCARDNAHLLIIETAEEAGVIRSILGRKHTFTNSESAIWFHAGFHDKVEEGKFVTIFGVPLTSLSYNVWAPGEPDNVAVGRETDQDCGGISHEARLADTLCFGKVPFICEQSL